jgi:hypothetical protein
MSGFFSKLPKDEAAAVPYQPKRPEPSSEIEHAARRHENELLAVDGVEGIGVAGDHISIYVRTNEVACRVPAEIEGFPVQVVVTGEIRAY